MVPDQRCFETLSVRACAVPDFGSFVVTCGEELRAIGAEANTADGAGVT